MRAITLVDFDHDLSLSETPTPEPAVGEVLVRVHASSINAIDSLVAAGMLKGMMEYRFPATIGVDLAGVVEKVGSGVTRFGPGEEVFGVVTRSFLGDGTWADYVTPAEGTIAPKPRALDFVHAAALPLAGTAALMAVDAVAPSEGDVVLVVGATGGVGSYAVQLAAKRGAWVIATGLTTDEARLRALGAAETVDYRQGDVAATVRSRHPGGISCLIDLVNRGEDFAAMAALVAAGGRAATTLGAADVDQLAKRSVTGTNIMAVVDDAVLGRLAELADAGDIQVPIERVYRFTVEDIKDGLRLLRSGAARGKLAVSLV